MSEVPLYAFPTEALFEQDLAMKVCCRVTDASETGRCWIQTIPYPEALAAVHRRLQRC